MMKWTNYHSHTFFSDGKGKPELYALSAIQKNMYAYGFSCHAPVPFHSNWNMKFERLHDYIITINNLKLKYRDRLKVYLGLEIDFVKDIIGFNQFKNLGLDYSIGAIHFLGFMPDGTPWDFDRGKDWFEKGLMELFNNDIKLLVSNYYQQVTEMILTQKTDVLAHFDLIKKYNAGNAYFNEKDEWYIDIAYGVIEILAKSDIILEVNSRGMLKGLSREFYPSNWLLERCLELKIPVCLSSDAHHPNDVLAYLPEARMLLQNIGYQEVYLFDDNGWNPISIK